MQFLVLMSRKRAAGPLEKDSVEDQLRPGTIPDEDLLVKRMKLAEDSLPSLEEVKRLKEKDLEREKESEVREKSKTDENGEGLRSNLAEFAMDSVSFGGQGLPFGSSGPAVVVEASQPSLKQSTDTGEEDEKQTFVCNNCLLYRYEANIKKWKRQGDGVLRVLENSDGAGRLVMRHQGTCKLLMNAPRESVKLDADMEVGAGFGITFVAFDVKKFEGEPSTSLSVFMVKFLAAVQREEFRIEAGKA